MNKILFIFSFLFTIITKAQTITDTIFFDTNIHNVKKSELVKLENIPFTQINLEGRADYRGNIEYNQDLSKKRVYAVQKNLLKNRHSSDSLTSEYFGETKPINNSLTKNRCVIFTYQVKNSNAIDKLENIQEEEKKEITNDDLFPVVQATVFTFQNNSVQNFLLENGTKIHIDSNSFDTSSTTEIQLSIKSYSTKSEFILADLHSMSSNHLLESAGMYHITASVKNIPIKLNTNKFIHLEIPNPSKKPDFKLFNGVITADEKLNWVESSTNKKITTSKKTKENFIRQGSFSIDGQSKNYQLKYKDPLVASVTINGTPHLKPYRSKWFKLNRYDLLQIMEIVDKPIKFQVNVTIENKKLISHQLIEDSGKFTNTFKNEIINYFKNSEWKKTKARTDLTLNFNYGKIDIRNIIGGVNIEQKQDSLNTVLLNVNKLGWINCDRFALSFRKKEPIIITTDSNASVKLIFTKINSIMNPSAKENGKFIFTGIPITEPFKVLAFKQDGSYVLVAEKNRNSNTELIYQKMTIKEFAKLLESY